MAYPTHSRHSLTAFRNAEVRLAAWLARHSIDLLRITVGLVFLGFGVLKFFPGLSPAEPLAARTLDILTLGLMPERMGLFLVASLETLIGLLLLAGRGVRVALGLLVVELIGILSPIVLLPGEMFRGSIVAPTLAGQYVLKDIVLVAAALVIAARTLGARLVVERR
jgi:putative oxidoreductase